MNELCITDAVKQFGISSKTLRYYESVGLIASKRGEDNNYRFFSEPEVERIKQIMVLRKMQIPIKDIIRIYESDDMSILVETFVNRLRVIDEEVTALGELRQVVNDFLQVMLQKGVKKISALPLLYEGMEKQMALPHPITPSIVDLPAMRVISSYRKGSQTHSDLEGFWHWAQTQNIPAGRPGCHERFELQSAAGDVMILRAPDGYVNNGPYRDYIFPGGLFAVANIFLDEDIGERFRALVSAFDDNKFYKIDYAHDGSLRQEAMIENLVSPDEQRALVSLFVPVKKRLADYSLYNNPDELPPKAISITEIEQQNPILWSKDAAMDKLIPINSPHYRVTEDGEAEYISWISTRVLSTGIAVKLPYRVDIEFKIGTDSGGFGHGNNETSIRLHHGEDINYFFGINMHNSPDARLSKQALTFHQPIFGNKFSFPKIGGIKPDVYNQLTWIVGLKHFAVIINDEIRYVGTDFPYMTVDLTHNPALPIAIGSNSSIARYFKSIRVSQLAQLPRNKIQEGVITMTLKQSNNIIPNIHRFITSEHGENYWFNGCARYVMESLGEYTADSDLMTDEIKDGTAVIKDYGYWLFAGLSGDIFTHFYYHNHDFGGDAVSSIRIHEGDTAFVESIFEKCGYASTYVQGQELSKNKEMYRQTLIGYIDKGIPVIAWGSAPTAVCGVYVGYEEYGKTLLYLTGDKSTPERISFEAALFDNPEDMKSGDLKGGWVFLGEKVQDRPIAEIYQKAIQDLTAALTRKSDTFYFGPEALRAWADAIDGGWFDKITPDEFDLWGMHTNYVCVLATNGSCAHNFLMRAMILNPDMDFLDDINKLYKRTADIWNNDNGQDLEALGGGFNVSLETLQNKEKRGKIAAKIREAAVCMDEVVQILQDN